MDETDEDEEDDDRAEAGYDPQEAMKLLQEESGPSAQDIDRLIAPDDTFKPEDEEKINEYYKQRYAYSGPSHSYGQGEQMSDDISQHSILPGVKDPNLWVVRCRIGEEKNTALHLMRKFLTYENEDQPLMIKSVVCLEHLKGYIYIEAYKQTHVKHAIDGIGNLRAGLYKQQMVPIKQMPDVLKVVQAVGNLREGSWVRVKSGKFKGDLAQVFYCQPSQNQVCVKLIPRIDYTRKRGALKTNEESKRKGRIPQKLFDPDLVKSIGGDWNTDGDYIIFEGNRYSRKGFLYKNLNVGLLITEGVKPTMNELEKFEESAEKDSLDLQKLKWTEEQPFAPGDNVEVVTGELQNLQGKVVKVEGGVVEMLPKHKELKERMSFPAHELRKYFHIGDHVKVLKGNFSGDTGLVVAVEDKELRIISDLSMHELLVLPRDVQLCTDRATGVDSAGKFEHGQMVMIEQQQVGVIVRLEREYLHILTMHGHVKKMKETAVQPKKSNRNARALDADNKEITVGDMVKVQDGPHSGHQGQVKHIFRAFVFLHSRLVAENSGMFVCRARHISVAGKTSSSPSNILSGSMSPRIASPKHPSQGGAGRGRMSDGSMRNRKLIGQTVRITQGGYKGYIGIVKDATDDTARVELHTGCNTVNVDINRLVTVNDSKSARAMTGTFPTKTPQGSMGGVTPSYAGSRTPMYGSQTPLYDGSRTPHYGGATPSHDGSRTPGGAWDPSASATPKPSDDEITHSPAVSFNPYTPAAPTPPTPFAAPTPSAFDSSNVDWLCSDLVVRVGLDHDDAQLRNQECIVKGATGNLATVQVPILNNKIVSVLPHTLEPVQPATNNRVKVNIEASFMHIINCFNLLRSLWETRGNKQDNY